MATAVLRRDVVSRADGLTAIPGGRVVPKRGSAFRRLAGHGDLSEVLMQEDALISDIASGTPAVLGEAFAGISGSTREIAEALRLDEIEGHQLRRIEPSKAMIRWRIRGVTGIEGLILQMYFGAVSLAEICFVGATLWGTEDADSWSRELVKGVIERINRWLVRPLSDAYPYVYLKSIELRRRRVSETKISRIGVAVGVNRSGLREMLGLVVLPEDSADDWTQLLADLDRRGLGAPPLVVGEYDPALRIAVRTCWGRSSLLIPFDELRRELLLKVSPSDCHWVASALAEVERLADRPGAERAAQQLIIKIRRAGYPGLERELSANLSEQLAYFDFPQPHWPRLQDLKPLQVVLGRIREQLRIIGPIMDDKVIALLAAADFRQQCRAVWNAKPAFHPAGMVHVSRRETTQY